MLASLGNLLIWIVVLWKIVLDLVGHYEGNMIRVTF